MTDTSWRNRVTLLVNSCDAYADLWQPFFTLLKRYFVPLPAEILLNTETKDFAFDGLNLRCVHSTAPTYGERMTDALREVKTEYTLLLLDEPAAGLDPEGRDEILSEVKEYHKKTGTTVLLVSHSMEDIAKYADRVLVMSNKKIAMYDTVENVFARAPELLALGLSVPQVTKIFLKLREMGVDVPADVYTVPYAVKMILEAKKRRDAGESLVLPRVDAKKGGAATC